MKRTLSLPMMTRVANVQKNTLNRKNRTFEITWTTGARVRRDSFWEGPYYEELGLGDSEVRMGRLKNRAPFLDNHGFTEKRGVEQVLGVIESAELHPDKEGTAVVKLSKRAEDRGILDDIEDGILVHVSAGYDVHSAEKAGEQDGVPIFRMTDWEPIEVSLVPAGADDQAMVRSKTETLREIDIKGLEDSSEEVQTDESRTQTTQEEVQQTSQEVETEQTRSEEVDNDELSVDNTRDQSTTGESQMTPEEVKKQQEKAAQDARAAEKVRSSAIRAAVTKARLKPELADEWIEKDLSVDKVREMIIDQLHTEDQKDENQTRSSNGTAEVGEDLSRLGRVRGMTDALLHRFRPTEVVEKGGVKRAAYEMTEEAKPYAFRSLTDLARMCLEANGFRTAGLAAHQIADKALQLRAAHSISDFSEILANTVNKTLRDGYMAAPQTWRNFTNTVFVPDFKEISRTNLGDAPQLKEVQENGEIERGTLSEAAEKYSVKEFARIVAISRKVIVNDDLNAMTRLPDRMGRRAADLESDTIWDIIKANPLMSDGQALFAAAHGNLSGTPAAPSETGLAELRKLMRRQVGLDGAELSLVPVWLYVPPEHETVAEKLIASIIPDSSSNVSPFSSSGRTPLQLAIEPRLETGANGNTDAWYEFASQDQVDMMEIAFLEGTNGPQVSTREGFDVAGMEIKITHDLGAKALDHRGMTKNAGV